MAFRSADLAIKLDLNDGNDNGYKLLILCGQISADNPTPCGGTNPDILLDGALASQNVANLRRLKEALASVQALVDERLDQPVPPQPNSDPETTRPTA